MPGLFRLRKMLPLGISNEKDCVFFWSVLMHAYCHVVQGMRESLAPLSGQDSARSRSLGNMQADPAVLFSVAQQQEPHPGSEVGRTLHFAEPPLREQYCVVVKQRGWAGCKRVRVSEHKLLWKTMGVCLHMGSSTAG